MSSKSIDILMKYVYEIFGSIFTLLSLIVISYIYIQGRDLVSIAPQTLNKVTNIGIVMIAFILLIFIMSILFVVLLRKSVLDFSEEICEVIDDIISEKPLIYFKNNKETLSSKIQSKLKHLIEMLDGKNRKYKDEKNSIKSLIADISHQIKTPISNISMYTETLRERELNINQRKEFLGYMGWQVSKLEWLVEALINMSRLETGVISLNQKRGLISETIANSLSGIYLKAEEKEINIEVECPDDLSVIHDSKWTVEALFNIVDNAVKYSDIGTNIKISVNRWDIFTKIDIKDNGIGIEEKEINNIFKRFYRAVEVSDIEGIGIGLYISKEIIIKQGGYIQVKSEKGIGSTFSIFLQN